MAAKSCNHSPDVLTGGHEVHLCLTTPRQQPQTQTGSNQNRVSQRNRAGRGKRFSGHLRSSAAALSVPRRQALKCFRLVLRFDYFFLVLLQKYLVPEKHHYIAGPGLRTSYEARAWDGVTENNTNICLYFQLVLNCFTSWTSSEPALELLGGKGVKVWAYCSKVGTLEERLPQVEEFKYHVVLFMSEGGWTDRSWGCVDSVLVHCGEVRLELWGKTLNHEHRTRGWGLYSGLSLRDRSKEDKYPGGTQSRPAAPPQ